MLILDPSSNDAEQTTNILRNSGLAVRATQITSEEELEDALEKQSWDLFIVKDKMENPSAEKCLKIVQHYGSDIPFIMTTTEYSVERTIAAMGLGMKDVIPEGNDEYFKLVVQRELSNIEDKNSRQFADRALVETIKRNELLLDSSRDAIAYITDGMHIYANNAYMELFGYDDPEDLECMPIMDLMASEQHNPFKKYLKDHAKGTATEDFKFTGLNVSGSNFEASLTLTDSKYDGEDCTQVYIKTADASDAEMEQRLKEISAQDRLTGLYNQHYFTECVTESISKAASGNQLSAVFYLALDNFDNILDEHGITNSDLYLKEVGKWLEQCMQADTILARIGGSTFTMLTKIETPADAEVIAVDLCKQFVSHMFEVSAHTITDSLSIGICPVEETSPNAEIILSNAHFASSSVQSKGGNSCRIHDQALDSLDNREDAQTAMELQDAKDADLIMVMYEPIVKLHGEVRQIFNARLAIENDQGKIKPIAEVFNIGLRTSTALKLDNWLMTESFAAFADYLPGHQNCKLKIHLSAASLLDDNIISNICGLLSHYKIPEKAIIFEFCEKDAAAYLKRTMQVIKLMANKHLVTALSGFGSTADSQTVVNSVNCNGFSWISVEPSLFENFLSNTDNQAKVSELVSFAHTNELATIVPEISDAGSLATIWPMNVGHIHGEYIASASDSLEFDFSEVAF